MSTIIPEWRKPGADVIASADGSEESEPRRLVIAIDGPAGVGKSTVARRLASRLGYTYLDTGALYRGVAWKVAEARVDAADAEQINAMLASTRLDVRERDSSLAVVVDAKDVTGELRTLAVSQLASAVAVLPTVREWLLPIQRRFAHAGGVVAEGRDIGTRVFPQAEVKFFLDAEPDVRVQRRHRELEEGRQGKPLEEVEQDIALRDARDRSRDVAPLVPAADAITIDTSRLSVDHVLTQMMDVVTARL